MPKYFLGIDIGGTKSHALIADESGQVVGFGRAGSGNWEGVGYDGLQRVLGTITDQAIAKAGIDRAQIAGAAMSHRISQRCRLRHPRGHPSRLGRFDWLWHWLQWPRLEQRSQPERPRRRRSGGMV